MGEKEDEERRRTGRERTISPITDIFEFEVTFTPPVGDVRKMAEH